MFNKPHLINVALFITGWVICLTASSNIALLTTVVILCIHLKYVGHWQKEKEVLLITLVLGCAVDSFAGNLNLLDFSTSNRLLPLWMACIWALAGTTIRHSLSLCKKRHWMTSIAGFVFASINYSLITLKTEELQISSFWPTVFIMAIIWSVLVPVLLTFSAVWLERYKRNNM